MKIKFLFTILFFVVTIVSCAPQAQKTQVSVEKISSTEFLYSDPNDSKLYVSLSGCERQLSPVNRVNCVVRWRSMTEIPAKVFLSLGNFSVNIKTNSYKAVGFYGISADNPKNVLTYSGINPLTFTLFGEKQKNNGLDYVGFEFEIPTMISTIDSFEFDTRVAGIVFNSIKITSR